MHSLADIIIGGTANTMGSILWLVSLLPWPAWPEFLGAAVGAVAGTIGAALAVLGSPTRAALVSALTWLLTLQLILIPLAKVKGWSKGILNLISALLHGGKQ